MSGMDRDLRHKFEDPVMAESTASGLPYLHGRPELARSLRCVARPVAEIRP